MQEPLPPPLDLAALPRARYGELRHVPLKLRLGSFEADILGWGFIDGEKWWRNYLHAHSYFEICYAFRGRGTFRMLGTDYPVSAGEVFVAKPREEHEIVADEADPLGIYFWSYTLLPETTPSAEHVLNPHARAQQEAIDRLLHAFAGSRRWVSRNVPGMERTLQLLAEEVVRREPGYVGVVEGLVRKLLLDTARAAVEEALPPEAVAPVTRDPREALVQQAVRYLRDNFGRIQSVREIAAQVNLSERHFSRLFKAGAGESPQDMLARVRVEAAAQKLLDRRLPIKEIAAQVGYPDVRYFTTVFRRQMGLPPAEYRAKGGTRFRDPEREARKRPGHVTAPRVPGKDRGAKR
ncbi:MAG: AraC family transcriptional regulator [Planctomycetota bacterium]|nr:AraC family transcriptional regulator [Planctomycetota bacterium]